MHETGSKKSGQGGPRSHTAIAMLEELLEIPSPPGREQEMAALVAARLRTMGYEPERDAAGNVLVRLGGTDSSGTGGPAIWAAHMDEIAMTVRAVLDDGTLRVGPSGGFLPRKFGEGPVTILGDVQAVAGVFSMGSGHTSAGPADGSPWDAVRVHTGLSWDELREAGVRPGSPMVPVRERRGPVFLGSSEDPLVGCWTFDDRMGIVALLQLLQVCRERNITPQRDTIVAFTVHEEGGCHGAKFLADRERPDVFIAVDGCPVSTENGLRLDGRPGIWSQDKLANFSQDLVSEFSRLAREAGEELQVAVLPGAASDASHVYAAGGAGRIVTVGHVRENSHGFEVARLSCFDRLLRVLVRCFEAWEP